MNLLLDSALKATVILLAALLAARALRRASADVRHTIWIVAILAVAMLPAVLSIPSSAIPSAARIVVPALTASTKALVTTRKLPWLFMISTVGVSVSSGAADFRNRDCLAHYLRSARTLDGALFSEQAATPMTCGLHS